MAELTEAQKKEAEDVKKAAKKAETEAVAKAAAEAEAKAAAEVAAKAEAEKIDLETLAKRNVDQETEIAELKKSLNEERDIRVIKQFVDRVRGDYKNIPGNDPEKLGRVFKNLSEKSPDDLKYIEDLLKSCDEAIAKGDLFKAVGADSRGDTVDTAYARVNSLAAELVQKNVGMTIHQARTQVMKTNRELRDQYQSERN